MKIKALFTALLFSILSYAQNGIVRGTVYEDETGEALFYASAQVPSVGAVAFTDFDGKEVATISFDFSVQNLTLFSSNLTF